MEPNMKILLIFVCLSAILIGVDCFLNRRTDTIPEISCAHCPIPVNGLHVCAEDTYGNKVTFGSECLVGYESCVRKKAYRIIYKEQCFNPCEAQCVFKRQPIRVCAKSLTDGSFKDFPSSCDVNNYNLCKGTVYVVHHEGFCAPTCQTCPVTESRVCGRTSDGFEKTFLNECFLVQENCRLGTDYTIISAADCPGDHLVPVFRRLIG